MFDTMTLTKVIGGLCGTFLVFLLGGWAADLIYATGGGHGDHHEQAYIIEVEGDDHSEEVVEEVDFSVIMASASAADGEGEFRPCKACHSVEPGEHGIGPSLYGVVGRTVGAEDGFGYSGSLVAVADVWNADHLNDFLERPSGFAPGTAMNFNGVRKIEDRANLIAYLDSLDD
ncbi:cytochrome c family protein [Yoonia sp. I 8.24]|uniref:c-type cytochrome n=1 Tax=Yoonia sp. I 8.24 TaxID=1537229 RepID=UPI001EDE81B9|nr:c-type cytochrome [Yoonia sp. I 8.24]MCG3266953.1 c-type cytochrome [Yoonia sp. I 8.24]